jgi:hypothetical protein
MAEGGDRDTMTCRACGREERASEGYPCDGCGTFICIMCNFRGVTRCAKCAASSNPPAAGSAGEA